LTDQELLTEPCNNGDEGLEDKERRNPHNILFLGRI
jgi:hypothetical protein